MILSNEEILLHLSLISGVGGSKIAKLLIDEELSHDLSLLYIMDERQFVACGLSYDDAVTIKQGLQDRALLDQELKLLAKHPVKWTTILNDSYPQLLKNIHLPPPVIYYRGKLPQDDKAIAFVGSRIANSYGEYVINEMIPELVKQNFSIISGGALGADSMAHRATLNAGGHTVVVLGSGLLQLYPISNRKLFEEIVAGNGAVISNYPLLMEPLAFNFPARNRIISGLSRGSVVIQAAKKSGALITAHFALEQGRDIFAVPGMINDPLSAGCHGLIAQGAKLVSSAADILIEYGIKLEPDTPAPDPIVTGRKKKEVEGQLNVSDIAPEKPSDIDLNDMSPRGRILAACYKAATSSDELLELTGLSSGELNSNLFELQIENKLTQNFMGLWHLK